MFNRILNSLLNTLSSVILVFGLFTSANAQNFPQPTSVYVNDFAKLLDPSALSRIEKMLKKARDDSGQEITLLTINSRRDYEDSSSLETFATNLFNNWGIGDAERNDGVLILVAKEDREMRIELGSGFPPVYDDRMKNVIDAYFLPHFRQDDYQAGIEAGVAETLRRAALTPDEIALDTPNGRGILATLSDFFIPIVMIATFLLLALKTRISDTVTRLKSCPNCHRRGMVRQRHILQEATREITGLRQVRTTCRHCDYREEKEISIPRRRINRSGNSGFGGGRSGGGGASGRW